MKLLLILLVAVSFVCAEVQHGFGINSVYDYLEKIGIPEGERIRNAEEKYLDIQSRIVGGAPAELGQHPYQAGLISDILGIQGRGICGGSLISRNRILTAAHCWYDGRNQAWRFEIVLGSVFLFSGGYRTYSTEVAVHPRWFPLILRNDVAVIYLNELVVVSNIIAPIALPSGLQIFDNFSGSQAFASGYGLTEEGGGISQGQYLSDVSLNVISNMVCGLVFSVHVTDSNVCTSGSGGTSICRGDSGGPLVVIRNNIPILIGVTSFGVGCQRGFPAAYARVTSFLSFINEHM